MFTKFIRAQISTALTAISIFAEISIIVVWVEVFTYHGSIYAHTHIHSEYILVLSIVFSTLLSAIFLLNSEVKKRENKLFNNFTLINKVQLSLSLFLYIFLSVIEAHSYPNYVFTKFHVNIPNISSSIYIGINYLALELVVNKVGTIKKYLKENLLIDFKNIPQLIKAFILIFTLYVFAWIISKNSFNTFVTIMSNDQNFPKLLHANYDEKMYQSWGREYYYWKFLKSITPENATIYIPPQEFPWSAIGNAGLVRYFLYPRQLINLKWNQSEVGDNSFIVVAWGDWKMEDKNTYGWPKIQIKAKGTWYFTENQRVEYVPGNYTPVWDSEDRKWGLIEVLK